MVGLKTIGNFVVKQPLGDGTLFRIELSFTDTTWFVYNSTLTSDIKMTRGAGFVRKFGNKWYARSVVAIPYHVVRSLGIDNVEFLASILRQQEEVNSLLAEISQDDSLDDPMDWSVEVDAIS